MERAQDPAKADWWIRIFTRLITTNRKELLQKVQRALGGMQGDTACTEENLVINESGNPGSLLEDL